MAFFGLGVTELVICWIITLPLWIVVIVVAALSRSRRRPSTLLAPTAAPGWLADPTRRHEMRYWDGIRWTSAVSDRGIQSEDPV